MSCLKPALLNLSKSGLAWVNGGIAPALLVLESQFHLLEGVLGPKWYAVAFVTLCVVNVVLKFKGEYTAAQHELVSGG